MNKKLTMLMILDGYGINENKTANAVEMAETPFLDKLKKQMPSTMIKTSGLDVGLPERTNGKFRSRTHQHRCSEELFIRS